MIPSYSDFEAAQAAAGENDKVCGTLMPSGEPVYFVMPKAAPEEQVRDSAFEVRNGRPMSVYERFLLDKAQQLQAVAP